MTATLLCKRYSSGKSVALASTTRQYESLQLTDTTATLLRK
ncbi:hypothetical protein [Fibrobacter sp. UWOV1]|nr:hypothetical protein [Fibrobacter sp. UWOV1]